MWNCKICDVTLGGGGLRNVTTCDKGGRGKKVMKFVWRHLWMPPYVSGYTAEHWPINVLRDNPSCMTLPVPPFQCGVRNCYRISQVALGKLRRLSECESLWIFFSPRPKGFSEASGFPTFHYYSEFYGATPLSSPESSRRWHSTAEAQDFAGDYNDCIKKCDGPLFHDCNKFFILGLFQLFYLQLLYTEIHKE